jgi:hypothetical protein
VLADGIPKSPEFPNVLARPTRSAIVKALRQLSERVGSNDFVYIHVSSRGSKQPKTLGDPAPQPFDRNQVMLPFDVRPSKANGQTIPNGLVDEDFGKLLDLLRAKVANVWIVVDMCHAGTATRGNLVARYIDPADLGIKFAAMSRCGPVAIRPEILQRGIVPISRPSGNLIAFFAVNSTQLSYEKSFPGYASPLPGQDQTLGVFTFLLHRALSDFKERTYRDLANDILEELDTGAAGHGFPLPLFEGDLDRPLWPSGAARTAEGLPARYEADSIHISAGRLHGIVEGSTVVLLKNLKDGRTILGEATVTDTEAAASKATLKSGTKLAEGQVFWAQLRERAASLSYRVSEPPTDETREEGGSIAATAILSLKQTDMKDRRISIEWVPAGSADADFQLWVKDQQLWITGSTGELHTDTSQPNASPNIPLLNSSDVALQ